MERVLEPAPCHCFPLSRFGCLCLLLDGLPDRLSLRLARFNRDLAGFALRLGEGNSNLQDAIVEVGFGLVRLGALGQGNFAIEGSIRPLGTMDSAALLLPLAFPLSLNDQRILVDFYLHVLLV